MDMDKVLAGLSELVENAPETFLPPPGRMCDREHLFWMLDQIDEGKVYGEKAHRWIGYIQGVLVSRHVTTVEEMKEMNR